MPISTPAFQPIATSTTSEKSSLDIIKTTITTTETQIETPDSGEFEIFHQTENGIVFIGYDDVTNEDIELENGDVINFTDMKSNDYNEIYGIVDSGSIVVYAVSTINY